jgi:hypothetical protein
MRDFKRQTFLGLRRCGVIPVQSFGSHICPQLPGLGFKVCQILIMLSESRN